MEHDKVIRGIKKTYLGAFSDCDNTSRKDEAGFIVPQSKPRRFGKFIENMLQCSKI